MPTYACSEIVGMNGGKSPVQRVNKKKKKRKKERRGEGGRKADRRAYCWLLRSKTDLRSGFAEGGQIVTFL
jgi:hypothetical protein